MGSSLCAGEAVEASANSFIARVTEMDEDIWMIVPQNDCRSTVYMRKGVPQEPIWTDINGQRVRLIGTVWK